MKLRWTCDGMMFRAFICKKTQVKDPGLDLFWMHTVPYTRNIYMPTQGHCIWQIQHMYKADAHMHRRLLYVCVREFKMLCTASYNYYEFPWEMCEKCYCELHPPPPLLDPLTNIHASLLIYMYYTFETFWSSYELAVAHAHTYVPFSSANFN